MKQRRIQPGARIVCACLAVAAGLACAIMPSADAATQTVSLSRIDPGLTSPTGYYRWQNVAEQVYKADYRSTYSYDQATVQLTFDTSWLTFHGRLVGTNLKPNFAYQLKIVGTPDTPSNESIGLAGRWWEQYWTGTEWSSGWNLNWKGDGSSPNPNDLTYFSSFDAQDPSSPTGMYYRYTGYMVFGFFITDSYGNITYDFATNRSHHVLWKNAGAWSYTDGLIASFDVGPTYPAYDVDYSPATYTVYPEWERLSITGLFLRPGTYDCQVMLTEESFHSTTLYGGNWAAAMGAPVHFTIVPPVLGDVTLDCTVNIIDLIFVRSRLNQNVTTGDNRLADVNNDGVINILDLIWVRNRLGSKCAR